MLKNELEIILLLLVNQLFIHELIQEQMEVKVGDET
jgi:hypothetical protein